MDQKQIDALALQAHNDLANFRAPLQAIAVVQLAREFYSDEQRASLVRTFADLSRQEQKAHKAHKEARDDVDGTRDSLWETAHGLTTRLKEMRLEHPLIAELVESRDELCHRDHMGRLA